MTEGAAVACCAADDEALTAAAEEDDPDFPELPDRVPTPLSQTDA